MMTNSYNRGLFCDFVIGWDLEAAEQREPPQDVPDMCALHFYVTLFMALCVTKEGDCSVIPMLFIRCIRCYV
uniref:Uncharacterized protein n=1 Tax=Steinernema glaseri TaxID=37863 RepID=A0A1I7ZWY9_9BILA